MEAGGGGGGGQGGGGGREQEGKLGGAYSRWTNEYACVLEGGHDCYHLRLWICMFINLYSMRVFCMIMCTVQDVKRLDLIIFSRTICAV